MPVRVKNSMSADLSGYLIYGNPTVRVPVQPNGGCDLKLGEYQSIDSPYPKGTKPIWLRDPTSYAYYMAIKMVDFDKQALYSTPLKFEYWFGAGGYPVSYYSPAGITPLNWFVALRSTVSRTYPSQAMKDKAFTMALSRVGESDFMGAVDLGEIHETMGFLKKPLSGLRDLFTNYQKAVQIKAKARRLNAKRGKSPSPQRPTVGKRDKFAYLADAASNTWLEYRYAAMPLILSVNSLVEEIGKSMIIMLGNVHSARGTNKETTSTDIVYEPTFLYDGTNIGLRRGAKCHMDFILKASYSIRYVYNPWMIDAINLARFGMSPTQVLSTSWELLKLSFVADWFVNIGDWIKAMEPKPHITMLDTCYTEVNVQRIVAVDDGGTWGYYRDLVPQSNCISSYQRSFMSRRNVTNNLTAPTPRFNPDWQTMKRTVDSLSLLWRPAANIARRHEYLTRRIL